MPKQKLSQVKVLMVAMHALLAEGIETVLRKNAGIEVYLANSPDEVVTVWKERQPQVVLFAGLAQTMSQVAIFVQIIKTCHTIPILQIDIENESVFMVQLQKLSGGNASLATLVHQVASYQEKI